MNAKLAQEDTQQHQKTEQCIVKENPSKNVQDLEQSSELTNHKPKVNNNTKRISITSNQKNNLIFYDILKLQLSLNGCLPPSALTE